VATLDQTDAGFAFTYVLPSAAGAFAAIRVAVLPRARRRGVGSALLAASVAGLRRHAPDCGELVLSAFIPSESAAGFAAYHGFVPVRRYWLMTRPGRDVPAPEWPEGIRLEGFDGGERGLARWVECFNRAWKEHDHPVLASVEDMRRHLAGGSIRADGMFLATRGEEAVGFVRNSLHATRGEIAVLGVVPQLRRHGLGRALLRHGVRWLLDRGVASVTLGVDGQNERAIALYREEGFEVTRTRQMWSRRLT
jgi:mycothiol synthase